MKNLTTLLVLLILAFNINAQNTPPTIQWQRCYGGSHGEAATSIVQTSDGGYIIAGAATSIDGDVTGYHGPAGGYGDYWIVKSDSLGNIQWQNCYGGSYHEPIYVNSVQQKKDGGYIVAGGSSSDDGDVTLHHGNLGGLFYDLWIVSLDSSGNIQWQRSLGGNFEDYANAVQQTTDGGYIVAGNTNSIDGDVSGNHDSLGNSGDFWIVRLDTVGNIRWQRCLGGYGDENAYSIEQTKDLGFIVAGTTDSASGNVSGNYGGTDIWVVKLDTLGNIVWQKSMGGSGSEFASSIHQVPAMGYIMAGFTNSNDGIISGNHDTTGINFDYWVVRLDMSGNILWQKCLGGTLDDWAYSLQITNDGGYVIAGQTSSNDGDVSGNHDITGYYYDYWIVKLDSVGNVQWQKCLGGSLGDYGKSIFQTFDNGYVIAGQSSSTDGDVSGNHDSTGYSYDYWIVKLCPAPLNIKEQKINSDVSIYPNPSNGIFNLIIPIETRYILITNFLGQVIERRKVSYQTEMNFTIKENGIYFVQIITNKETVTKKIIINNE